MYNLRSTFRSVTGPRELGKVRELCRVRELGKARASTPSTPPTPTRVAGMIEDLAALIASRREEESTSGPRRHDAVQLDALAAVVFCVNHDMLTHKGLRASAGPFLRGRRWSAADVESILVEIESMHRDLDSREE